MTGRYAARDTKSNTCSINARRVGPIVVENEHAFDRTPVRTRQREYRRETAGFPMATISPAPAHPVYRPTQPSIQRNSVRLTARGRLVAFLASLLALAALVVWTGQMVAATGGTGSGEPVAVVVGGGDTLWGIAQDIAPDQDPRSVVQQIRILNDLGTRSIVPGQSILVPVSG
jgi:hypothetical protein